MTSRKDCIDEILEAIGKRWGRKKVEEHFEEIEDRAEQYGGANRENLGRAAFDMMREEATRTAILRRNLRMDALKARDLRSFLDAARSTVKTEHGARLGVEAALVGTNTPIFDPKSSRGNQYSAAALGLGAKKDWVGGAILDMREAGVERVFYSRAIEREWALERYELSLGDRGDPGRTGNAQALAIAKILDKWDKARIEALNGEGAWISSYAGYVNRSWHDPDKLRKASSQSAFRRGFTEDDRLAWVADVLKGIDARRTFGGQEADKALAEMWGGLITGDHMEMSTPETQAIFPNVARKVSQTRELHWKSGEAWLAYNEKYGRFNPTDGWLYSMMDSADKYGLMRIFGSKPKEGYAELKAYAKNVTMGTAERRELDRWEASLDNRYGVVSGELARPVANMWSGIVNGIMAVQRVSKLGLTPFAMLQDNVTISRELARQGLGVLDRYGSIFSGYFQGGEGSTKREVAELLHTGILGRLRGVTARFDIADAKSGAMAAVENNFFKITGITGMTENKRSDAERLMAYNLGRQRDKQFTDLEPGLARMLQAFGIGEKEWGLLHKVGWNEINGERYLTPDVAKRLSDADVDAYLGAKGPTIAEQAVRMAEAIPGTPESKSPAVERARQELALKLWSYFSERGQYAVLEVGPKERAMLYRGTQAGSNERLALQLLYQFKQFPTAMVTRAWGADVYGGAKGMNRIAGLAELAVMSTLFGMAANYLNQFVKGQDPNSQIRNSPGQWIVSGFVRGGAASIYGDFLMGEWSRFGMSAAASALGPTFGNIDKAAELWSDLTHLKQGRAAAALGARVVRENIPFANMIYTKMAVDYLIYYRLMEWINPGYLQRYEKTMKDKSGIEFWLRPTQVAR